MMDCRLPIDDCRLNPLGACNVRRPPHRCPNRQSPIGNRPSAKAFTTVELLTVIGIIAILAGIITVAINVVSNNANARRTKVALENAMSLQREFENASPIDNLVTPLPVLSGSWTAAVGGTDRVSTCRLAANAANMSDVTALVMNRLARVPANKSALEKMSAVSVRSQSYSIDVPVTTPSPDHQGTGTLLLDGWGSAVQFVPGGGLTGVTTNEAGTQVARPDIVSPDRRPFWASPGPDGNLQTHDDNVYSFEN
jgi:type II secretory pathway pseudopilin PulG